MHVEIGEGPENICAPADTRNAPEPDVLHPEIQLWQPQSSLWHPGCPHSDLHEREVSPN